jgi:hypothetical protein
MYSPLPNKEPAMPVVYVQIPQESSCEKTAAPACSAPSARPCRRRFCGVVLTLLVILAVIFFAFVIFSPNDNHNSEQHHHKEHHSGHHSSDTNIDPEETIEAQEVTRTRGGHKNQQKQDGEETPAVDISAKGKKGDRKGGKKGGDQPQLEHEEQILIPDQMEQSEETERLEKPDPVVDHPSEAINGEEGEASEVAAVEEEEVLPLPLRMIEKPVLLRRPNQRGRPGYPGGSNNNNNKKNDDDDDDNDHERRGNEHGPVRNQHGPQRGNNHGGKSKHH